MKKVKKILAIAMIIATATTTCTFTGIIPENNLSVSAAEEVMKTDDGFQYEVNNNGEVTITKYIGTDTDVDIPSKIDGKPVTSIGEYAFYNYNDLISVTIPDSVTSIGDSAFIYCTGLTSVTMADSVTSIGNYAFGHCWSLTNISMSNSLTSIGEGTFCECWSLTNIIIPNSVTSIGDSAFVTCSSLTDIKLSNSLISIGDFAFVYCDFTNITIPDSVTSIGEYAFKDCDNLTDVKLSNSLISIKDNTFMNCDSLTNIIIPASVTSIGDYAFNWCSNLTNITIPDSVTSIGNYAFGRCWSLTNISMSNLLTSIGEGAFCDCSNLTNIMIPDSVTSIGAHAFDHCENLESIKIPNSVTTIKEYTFSYCGPLEITIPRSVTTIEDNAFNYCWATIYGYKDSYAETFAQNSSFEFKEIQESEQTLGITSFTADKVSPQKVGTAVTLTTDATGEGLQYKYYKYLNGKYELIKDWSSSSSITISPSAAGKYDLYVGVKDSSGKIVRKNIVFEFKEELGITSFTASKSSPQQVKTAVTLTAKATGVTGTANYKYYRYLNGAYAQIKDWSSNSSITIAPSTAGTYDLWVAVKDGSGKIVRKNMSFVFKNQNSLEISSFTVDKASPQEVGTEIKLTARATGVTGTANYKYYRYLNGVYEQIKDWSVDNTATIVPSTEGTYDLWVAVKDEKGNIVRKSMKYTVKKK
ncbi:MAG: leucine-rich repeat protein [Clostridium sp.]